MHEVSIAEGIVNVVEKTATMHDIKRIKSVRVSIGELAGVDIESLRFAWLSVTKGTVIESAELVIERPEGEAWCMTCSKTIPLHAYGHPCPVCGGYQLTATGGTELKVIDIIASDDQ